MKKGLWKYTVTCDSNHAQHFVQALVEEGWSKTEEGDFFSPITSFWSVTVTKGGETISFEADDWFCDIIVPKTIWEDYRVRLMALPN